MKASSLNSVLSIVLITVLLIFGGLSWWYLRANYTRSNYELITESQYVQSYQFTASDGQLVNSTLRLAWDLKGKRVVLYDAQYKRYTELSIEDGERLLHQYPLPQKNVGESILFFFFDTIRILTLILFFVIELIILSFPQALIVSQYIKHRGSLEDCQWYLKEDSFILFVPKACHVGIKWVKSRRSLIYKQELDQLIARANRTIKDENIRTMLKMPLQFLYRWGYEQEYPIFVLYDNRLMDQMEYFKKLLNQYQKELATDPSVEKNINYLHNAISSPKEHYAIPTTPFDKSRMLPIVAKALEKAFGKLLNSSVYHFSTKSVANINRAVPGIYLTLVVKNTDEGAYYTFKAGNVLAVRIGFDLSLVDNEKVIKLFNMWLPALKTTGYTYYDDNFDLVSCYETYLDNYMKELVNCITK